MVMVCYDVALVPRKKVEKIFLKNKFWRIVLRKLKNRLYQTQVFCIKQRFSVKKFILKKVRVFVRFK